MDLSPVRRLKGDDDLSAFDCGEPALDEWLRAYAFSDQQARASVTYVIARGDSVVGYYSVAPHAIEQEGGSADRLGRGLPAQRSIGVILLARIALDQSEHGNRLGSDLLRDALLRGVAGADEIGGRAVLVHAKHEKAASFYSHHGFQPLPDNPLHLYLLMKDIKVSIAEAG